MSNPTGEVFAMKGATCKKIHGAHSLGALEMRGNFHLQGPQPINDQGGAPQWVADLLEKNPGIESVALSGKNGSVVWSRIPTAEGG